MDLGQQLEASLASLDRKEILDLLHLTVEVGVIARYSHRTSAEEVFQHGPWVGCPVVAEVRALPESRPESSSQGAKALPPSIRP